MDLSGADAAALDTMFAAGGDAVLGDAILEEVYRRYGSLVYSFCTRVVGPDHAADVTQEVFVGVWRRRSSYDRSRGSLRAWLVTVAKSRCIDFLRANRRTGIVGQVPELAELDGELDKVAERMVLADALAEIPERQRQVVRLAHIDGLTHEEISATTGLPLGTVKSDLRRSMSKLAGALRGTETGAASSTERSTEGGHGE